MLRLNNAEIDYVGRRIRRDAESLHLTPEEDKALSALAFKIRQAEMITWPGVLGTSEPPVQCWLCGNVMESKTAGNPPTRDEWIKHIKVCPRFKEDKA